MDEKVAKASEERTVKNFWTGDWGLTKNGVTEDGEKYKDLRNSVGAFICL